MRFFGSARNQHIVKKVYIHFHRDASSQKTHECCHLAHHADDLCRFKVCSGSCFLAFGIYLCFLFCAHHIEG